MCPATRRYRVGRWWRGTWRRRREKYTEFTGACRLVDHAERDCTPREDFRVLSHMACNGADYAMARTMQWRGLFSECSFINCETPVNKTGRLRAEGRRFWPRDAAWGDPEGWSGLHPERSPLHPSTDRIKHAGAMHRYFFKQNKE